MRFTILLSFLFLCKITTAQQPKDGWSFNYPGDNFTEDALLDLRYLNEKEAGENGFIQLAEDGNSFVNESGEAVRFWSINGGDGTKNMSDAELARFARFLAKIGVNMIRYHGSINPTGSNINDVDKDDVNAIWRMVAAMKKEGIYSTISPFWAHNGHMGQPKISDWGIPGYANGDDLWEVMYFVDTLQNAYKNWVKYLYTEINPYTGIALKDDPAVALIQIKNEDGVFFWTISGIKPELEKIIRQKFYSWAVNKYESIDKARVAWSYASNPKDNFTEGELGVYPIWEATQKNSGGKLKRLQDQIRFFGETQKNFYAEIYDYYRNTLGCSQLINANNWKTADANLLFDAERYTNTAGEVLAVNRYFDPGHIGENSGWRIDPGHYYVGNSVLFEPHKLPVNIKQASGHPMLITESGWNLPNKYQAEGPFLISAFMSLTGVDSYYWFSPSSSSYDKNPYHTWANLAGGQHPLFRWTISTPGQIAMFPANALQFRKGMIDPAETMVHEERTVEEIFGLKMPLISEENSFDPNRDDYDNINPSQETEVSPLAHLTGKVEVVYDGNPANSFVSEELKALINYSDKQIKAANNQIEWDYKNGICMVDAPSSQGASGFLSAKGVIELSRVTIETTNEYANINVVSMDENNLENSSKILVQVGTVCRPSNWAETPAEFELNDNTVSGFRIDNTGKMPWKCANTEIKLTVKNSSINKATLLDAAGYPKLDINIVKNGDKIEIELPENAMYVVLENTTSVKKQSLNKSKMHIFPNPNQGLFSVEIPDYASKNYDLEIRNLLGQKVWEQKSIQQKRVEVELENNYAGLLVVALKQNNAVIDSGKIRVN
jgi:hypothetical protein